MTLEEEFQRIGARNARKMKVIPVVYDEEESPGWHKIYWGSSKVLASSTSDFSATHGDVVFVARSGNQQILLSAVGGWGPWIQPVGIRFDTPYLGTAEISRETIYSDWLDRSSPSTSYGTQFDTALQTAAWSAAVSALTTGTGDLVSAGWDTLNGYGSPAVGLSPGPGFYDYKDVYIGWYEVASGGTFFNDVTSALSHYWADEPTIQYETRHAVIYVDNPVDPAPKLLLRVVPRMGNSTEQRVDPDSESTRDFFDVSDSAEVFVTGLGSLGNVVVSSEGISPSVTRVDFNGETKYTLGGMATFDLPAGDVLDLLSNNADNLEITVSPSSLTTEWTTTHPAVTPSDSIYLESVGRSSGVSVELSIEFKDITYIQNPRYRVRV